MRRTWHLLEALHAVVYFAPETRPHYEAAGLKGYWRGYFASRAAPLGPVGPELVTACFHSFSLEMVARAVPDVWTRTSPARAQEARLAVMDDALRRIWGKGVDSAAVREVADSCMRALAEASPSGRPMFDACGGQEPPSEPHLLLFWAATALREYRGDGHIAVLRAGDLDGAAANRLMRAAGLVPGDQQRLRGWSDARWAEATASLQRRGELGQHGELTAAGIRLLEDNEQATDELANEPLLSLGRGRLETLNDALERLVRPIADSGMLPFPNPMGLPDARHPGPQHQPTVLR